MVIVPLGFVIYGGHITVLVTDFVQGLFMNVAALALVSVVLFTVFDWHQVVQSLKTAPQNASMLNPLHTSQTKDFTVWYYLIYMATAYYSVMSNVPSQGFQGSAKNAHELRMGNLLGQIRWQGLLVFFMTFVLVAYVFMHHPAHTQQAAAINAVIDRTVSANATASERTQMVVPAALGFILPHGFIGLFSRNHAGRAGQQPQCIHARLGKRAAAGHHPPISQKAPGQPSAHLGIARSIFAVALIAFILSLSIKPGQSILMYFALFNSVWLGPAGAVILGGLYWKRGTTRAALATFIFGTLIGIAFIIISQGWPIWTSHNGRRGSSFSINGQWAYLLNVVVSISIYVSVSLCGKEPADDMDKLLHRGPYAIAGEHPKQRRHVALWQRLFGITEQFNRADRTTAFIIVGYFLLSLATFAFGMLYAFVAKPGDDAWAEFWHLYMGIQFLLLIGGTLWLGIGGIRDMTRLFRDLQSAARDFSDDGTVKHEPTEQPVAGDSGMNCEPDSMKERTLLFNANWLTICLTFALTLLAVGGWANASAAAAGKTHICSGHQRLSAGRQAVPDHRRGDAPGPHSAANTGDSASAWPRRWGSTRFRFTSFGTNMKNRRESSISPPISATSANLSISPGRSENGSSCGEDHTPAGSGILAGCRGGCCARRAFPCAVPIRASNSRSLGICMNWPRSSARGW